MAAKEMDQETAEDSLTVRARRALNLLVGWHSNPNQVAALAGIESGYFHRTLRGERRLPDAVKDKALAAMGVDPEIFLELQLDEGGLSPALAARFLATCIDDPELPRDPFLDFLNRAVGDWQALGGSGPPNASRRAKVLAMVQELEDRPRIAKGSIENLLRELLEQAGVADLAGSDLAVALALWARARRLQGSRADSRDTFMLAFAALAQEQDFFAEGLLFQWAALLLDDFERASLGIQFCDRAFLAMALADAQIWVGPCCFIRGVLHFGQGRFAAAERWLREALSRLRTEQQGYKFSTLQALAKSQLELGNADAAFETIRQAAVHVPMGELPRAHLSWLEASAFEQLRRYGAAETRLDSALPILERLGEPLDAALATVDLAKITLRPGKTRAW